MSVVLVVKDVDSVHLAADSCFVGDDLIMLDTKVVKCRQMIFGFAGQASILSELRLFLETNESKLNKSLSSNTMSFKSWVYRNIYKEIGEELGQSSIIVATKEDFVVLEGCGTCLTDTRGYAAIGVCAMAATAAMGGALLQHEDNRKNLVTLAEEAVYEACSLVNGCEPPVEVVTI